jgi:hypothetical protein
MLAASWRSGLDMGCTGFSVMTARHLKKETYRISYIDWELEPKGILKV